MTDDLHSRMGRVETHVEYLRDDMREANAKLDKLLSKPSAGASLVAFVAGNWKTLAVILLTVAGGAGASPLIEMLKK